MQSDISERLWRAARVLAYAAELFGSPKRMGLWIVRDPLVLMGYRPVDLLAWDVVARRSGTCSGGLNMAPRREAARDGSSGELG